MEVVDLMFRAWNYFRTGYGTYLSFFVSFITFVSTTYYLLVRSVPFLQGIFPHFYIFVIVGIVVFGPLGVLIGWLHMKGTIAYSTDVAITVEANPYNYKTIPGKETEIIWPIWAVLLGTLEKLLEKENVLSPEEMREFENIQRRIQRLREGGVIGRPRQRRILAASERGLS